MFPNPYTATPPARYGYSQEQQAYVYDQNQPGFAAPGQYFVQTPRATPPPQPYQLPSVQPDQPPPGYQFQQYFPQVQLITPLLQVQNVLGVGVQTTVTPITPVTPVSQSSSNSTQEIVDTKTSDRTEKSELTENKQNDKEPKAKAQPEKAELPLAQTFPVYDSNGESIYFKLSKSDLDKPEWKRIFANYSTKDVEKPATDQTLKSNDSITVTNVPQQPSMVQTPSIAQAMPAVSNDSVTLTNVPQQPSMVQIPSVAQAPNIFNSASATSTSSYGAACVLFNTTVHEWTRCACANSCIITTTQKHAVSSSTLMYFLLCTFQNVFFFSS